MLAIQPPDSEKLDSHVVGTKKLMAGEQIVDEVIKTACQITGTRSLDVADRFIAQAGSALVWPKPEDADDHLIRASAVMAEMAPQNATEAMLATQMIAVNDAALFFLKRATLDQQCIEAVDANVLRATRLMRIFTEQIEAMQRLRGKGCQQKVTVEHVQVHGGQAVVGTVTTIRGVGDDRENSRNTP